MHILIFTGFYLPGFKGGGPIRTIANMLDQLGDEIQFSLYTNDRDLGESKPYSSIESDIWQFVGETNIFYASLTPMWIFILWRIIVNFKGNALNLNSFFSIRFSILPLILWNLRKNNKPIILGPRGEFSKGALNLKSRKKRIFIAISKFIGLHKNVIWHASTEHEATDIRRVMGNDVKIRIAIDLTMPGNDIQLTPRISNNLLRIVFISRISPMKNILGAIELLQNVREEVHFDVYGPAEDEVYWTECRHAAARLPANIVFAYCGVLQPLEVAPTLAKYDLFLFPTFGENYGHVIAEALFAGLPILISDATPWRDLEQKKLGWDIPLDQPDRFVACIEACCSMPADAYDKWRREIRQWAVANIGNQDAVDENRRLFSNLD